MIILQICIILEESCNGLFLQVTSAPVWSASLLEHCLWSHRLRFLGIHLGRIGNAPCVFANQLTFHSTVVTKCFHFTPSWITLYSFAHYVHYIQAGGHLQKWGKKHRVLCAYCQGEVIFVYLTFLWLHQGLVFLGSHCSKANRYCHHLGYHYVNCKLLSSCRHRLVIPNWAIVTVAISWQAAHSTHMSRWTNLRAWD